MSTYCRYSITTIGLPVLLATVLWGIQAPQDNLSFSLNVHEFGHPDLSAATVRRVIDIHEAMDVPVDVFLTTTLEPEP